jgi:Flp pilus assembly protein TadG
MNIFNPLKNPATVYLRALVGVRAERLRTAISEQDRGASAIELAIITAVLVGLAAAILAVIVTFATGQKNNITNTTVPAPGGP